MYYLLFLIFFIGCNSDNPSEAPPSDPIEMDSDLDGKVDALDRQLGDDPYLNQSFVTHYLGKRVTQLNIDHSQGSSQLKLLPLDLSQKYFYRKLIKEKPEMSFKDKELPLFKNLLGCLDKMQIKALQLKYPAYSPVSYSLKTDLPSDALKSNYYLYDFERLEPLHYTDEGEAYFQINSTFEQDGLCILYDQLSPGQLAQFSAMTKVVQVNYQHPDRSKFSIANPSFYDSQKLGEGLDLGAKLSRQGMYWDRFDEQEIIDAQSTVYRPGDRVLVYQMFQSRYYPYDIHHGTFIVDYGRYLTGPDGRQCTKSFNPQHQDNFSFKADPKLQGNDFQLTVGGRAWTPIFLDNFLAVYQVSLGDADIENGELRLNARTHSITKYEIPGIWKGKELTARHVSQQFCPHKTGVESYPVPLEFKFTNFFKKLN